MHILTLGTLVCFLAYLAGRWLCRQVLRIEGTRLLGRAVEERYFQTLRLRRLAWRLAGPLATYLACVLLALAWIRVSQDVVPSLVVEVLPDGPAAHAGMRSGDRILAINDVAPTDWDQVPRLISSAPREAPSSIRVRRGSEVLMLSVQPDANGRIRVTSRMEARAVPASRALPMAVALPIKTTRDDLAGLWARLTGEIRPELSGPVGIVREAATGADRGVARAARRGLMLFALATSHLWPLAIVLELVLMPRRPRPRAT